MDPSRLRPDLSPSAIAARARKTSAAISKGAGRLSAVAHGPGAAVDAGVKKGVGLTAKLLGYEDPFSSENKARKPEKKESVTGTGFLALVEANPIEKILKLKRHAMHSADSGFAMRQMEKIARSLGIRLNDVLDGKIRPEDWPKFAQQESVLGRVKDAASEIAGSMRWGMDPERDQRQFARFLKKQEGGMKNVTCPDCEQESQIPEADYAYKCPYCGEGQVEVDW